MELLTVSIRWLEGTSQVNSIAAVPRVKVSADGHGVVSHAGVGMLREVAGLTGLSTQVTAVLADTYRGPWIYDPGSVFADLAAAVAGGADCINGVGQRCGDREHVFGPAASTTTMWRLVDQRIDAAPSWPSTRPGRTRVPDRRIVVRRRRCSRRRRRPRPDRRTPHPAESPRPPVRVRQRGPDLRIQPGQVHQLTEHSDPGMRHDTMPVRGHLKRFA